MKGQIGINVVSDVFGPYSNAFSQTTSTASLQCNNLKKHNNQLAERLHESILLYKR